MLIKLLLPKFWRHKGGVSYVLLPFSFIYRAILGLRRFYYRCLSGIKFPVPVIVVGNITVGGTGKTPLVIFLTELLQSQGYTPGVVTRGYGRKSGNSSLTVTSASGVDEVGDEAVMIYRRLKCPIVVDVDRVRAVSKLLQLYGCNIIISDDGLQHYALERYLEIILVDAEFKFGNNFCLPAGPLREPLSRLKRCDFVVENFNTNLPRDGFVDNRYGMVLDPVICRNVVDPTIVKAIDEFKGRIVHAVAGIGMPNKFFRTLQQQGLNIIEHPFPDHHRFCQTDFLFEENIVLMTEKDAVKCVNIANKNFWYIETKAKPSQEFVEKFLKKIRCYGKLCS